MVINRRKAWRSIRWRMLIIFSCLSVISVGMTTSFLIAILNVVIRRECAYLVEEQIKGIVESRKGVMDPVLDRIDGCKYASYAVPLALLNEYLNASWPGSRSVVIMSSLAERDIANPSWLGKTTFAGIVEDRGKLEIRFLRVLKRNGCSISVLVKIPLGEAFLNQLSSDAGLEVVDTQPMMLPLYRAQEGVFGEIRANFIPGSRRPVPVVVVAQDWQSGTTESWVLYQIRPSYSQTIEDLSRMGLRRASWLLPLVSIGSGLFLAYVCGVSLSARLSRRIVTVIDMLCLAALQVGGGDFSVSLPEDEQDQLGLLLTAFNSMTSHLRELRELEGRRILLERDIKLAQEAQQYLYPRCAPTVAGAQVWGMTAPARIVSGDLYDFFPPRDDGVGLLCADVSGKGMSAALMMAHLQAVGHGRMLAVDGASARPSPSEYVAMLNRDLCGRFGDSRYATMFYGEYDSSACSLRYINAGHCPPIFISSTGEVTVLRDGDLPIGLFPKTAYHELRVALSRGCAMVVYSDGLIDALNLKGEEFGEERLLGCCRLLPKNVTAESICTSLSQRVSEWSMGAEQVDDITILVLVVN